MRREEKEQSRPEEAAVAPRSLPLTPHCAIAVLLAAALGGCGTPVTREPSATKPPATTASRPGGYYLDDGPGASPPADLDSIPDAVPKSEPLHRAATRPYVVMGRSYTPMTALQPYKARGIATWYGRRYHGKQTSSGEIYDMYAMTAAHTTLPIPSYARVTHLGSGKSVVVRINDRGPFVEGRIIDLSYTAAHRIGVLAGGSAMVEVEAILPGSRTAPVAAPAAAAAVKPEAAPVVTARVPPPVAVPPPAVETPPAAPATQPQIPVSSDAAGYYLQLGAFGSRENAENFLARVRAQADWLGGNLHIFTRDGLFRVHSGPYASQAEARQTADRVGEALGAKPVVLTR